MFVGMKRAVAPVVKHAKRARGTASKKAGPEPMMISRPASPRQTEKTFGVSAQRSREIDALVDEATR
jgi:hypothetical protein